MNKFDLLNDATTTEEYHFNLYDIVSLKSNWRLHPKCDGLPTQNDPYINDQDIFKIIHIYDRNFIHIESTSSGHRSIAHKDWINIPQENEQRYPQFISQYPEYRVVILKNRPLRPIRHERVYENINKEGVIALINTIDYNDYTKGIRIPRIMILSHRGDILDGGCFIEREHIKEITEPIKNWRP